MSKQKQEAGLCQISKNKLKFQYFKNISYLELYLSYVSYLKATENINYLQNLER